MILQNGLQKTRYHNCRKIADATIEELFSDRKSNCYYSIQFNQVCHCHQQFHFQIYYLTFFVGQLSLCLLFALTINIIRVSGEGRRHQTGPGAGSQEILNNDGWHKGPLVLDQDTGDSFRRKKGRGRGMLALCYTAPVPGNKARLGNA